MDPMPERWTRGAGSGGIGHSGHVNEYSNGVLINHFVEEIAGEEMKARGTHILGAGAPFAGNSTQRASYTPENKTGEVLMDISERQDQEPSTRGIGGEFLTRHGDFWQPRESYFATINQLTYKADRQHGEPRVQAYTWSGSNRHNATVPHSTQALDMTTTTKRQQWQQEAQADMYTSTSRAGQLSAALVSAAEPGKQGTLKLATDGQPCMVGRKPKGDHAAECDKTYRRTGLRSVYYNGSIC